MQDHLDAKNFYAFNPSFDKGCNPPDTIATPKAVPVPAACAIPSPCGQGTTTGCVVQQCDMAVPLPDSVPVGPACQPKCCCNAAENTCNPCACDQPAQAVECPPACNPCSSCGPSRNPCGPCNQGGPVAMPYAAPYNKRPNRSCGCG